MNSAELPDDARLWAFPVSRTPAEAEASFVLASVGEFLDRWSAHGKQLVSGRELRHQRHRQLLTVVRRGEP